MSAPIFICALFAAASMAAAQDDGIFSRNVGVVTLTANVDKEDRFGHAIALAAEPARTGAASNAAALYVGSPGLGDGRGGVFECLFDGQNRPKQAASRCGEIVVIGEVGQH